MLDFCRGLEIFIHSTQKLLHWTLWEVPHPVNQVALCVCVCVCVCVCMLSCLVVFDSSWLHGLQPTTPLCPWGSPGKNTGVGCHLFLKGIFITQGSKLCLLHLLQADSLPLSHLENSQVPLHVLSKRVLDSGSTRISLQFYITSKRSWVKYRDHLYSPLHVWHIKMIPDLLSAAQIYHWKELE